MASGFFSSGYFVVSAVVAIAIVGAAAGAYYLGSESITFSSNRACGAPSLTGALLSATPQITHDEDGRRRTEAYSLDAASYEGGSLDLCVSVGEIYVEPATGTSVELIFDVMGDRALAVSGTEVKAEFRSDGGGLTLGAWESVRGRSEGVFRGDSAEVRLTLRIPASGAYRVVAHNDVGDIRVSSLLVSSLDARTDVGTILVREVDLTGDATLRADVGDVILEAASVQTGEIIVRSDVGNAEAILPSRADVGYDAHASTNVGEAVIRIGDTESYTSEGDGPGEDERARSAGFAQKPTRVVVSAVTDVGDARITAN